ncbi:recombination-associated protein RdgC, partial [Cronobacter sakazakii]
MFNPFFKNLIIYRLSRDLVIIRDGNTEELARQ